MHLDRFGLPTQENGDANDQLQRVGFALTAVGLGADKTTAWSITDFYIGLSFLLKDKPGIWKRHFTANPNNCSADQIIGALGAAVVWGEIKTTLWTFLRMMLRLGFAQNYKDGLNDDPKTKIPDFMFFRAMPLFCRSSILFYPLAFVFDFYLLVLAVGDWVYLKTEKDPVDINNTLITLTVCRKLFPTPWSWLSYRLWPKLRPTILEDLRRYHRAEAGGNPEMAELWVQIITEMMH